MVFAYLVAPAIIALAWLVGLVASAVGLLASYRWDLPSGPAIVCTLGLLLVLFGLWRHLRKAPSGGRPD